MNVPLFLFAVVTAIAAHHYIRDDGVRMIHGVDQTRNQNLVSTEDELLINVASTSTGRQSQFRPQVTRPSQQVPLVLREQIRRVQEVQQGPGQQVPVVVQEQIRRVQEVQQEPTVFLQQLPQPVPVQGLRPDRPGIQQVQQFPDIQQFVPAQHFPFFEISQNVPVQQLPVSVPEVQQTIQTQVPVIIPQQPEVQRQFPVIQKEPEIQQMPVIILQQPEVQQQFPVIQQQPEVQQIPVIIRPQPEVKQQLPVIIRPVVQQTTPALPQLPVIQLPSQGFQRLNSAVNFPGAVQLRVCSPEAPGTVDMVLNGRAYHFSWCHRSGRDFLSQARTFTWQQAADYATILGNGFQPVSIEDRNEDSFIATVMRTHVVPEIWTSGFQQQGVWFWGSGRNDGYTNWSLNPRTGRTEPDNANGNEFCLAVKDGDRVEWHDESCNERKLVVCETRVFYRN